uniref:Uncharacterized protein n=1 Tax=Ammonifex degensii TaxID=42838 RepID=A0A7C1J8C0_9THEO
MIVTQDMAYITGNKKLASPNIESKRTSARGDTKMPHYWHQLFGFFTIEPRRGRPEKSREEKVPEDDSPEDDKKSPPVKNAGAGDGLPPNTTIVSSNLPAFAAETSSSAKPQPPLPGGEFELLVPGIFRFRSPRATVPDAGHEPPQLAHFSFPAPSRAFEKTNRVRDGLPVYRFR